jgi:hypothetical protein
MKLLIFNPKPDESKEVLCNHLYIDRSSLKKARRITSSLLIHNYEKYYITLNPYYPEIDRWIVPENSYSYKPLTVVPYED